MNILILLIIFAISIYSTKAELDSQAIVDSLIIELDQTEEDSNRVNVYNEISYNYRYLNPDKGLNYGFKGLKLSKEIDWEIGEAKCLFTIGVCYFKKSNFVNAENYFLKSLIIYEKLNDENNISILLYNIASIYYEKSDYPKAFEFYYKSLKLDEKNNKLKGVANNLSTIGNIFLRQSEYSKAQEYYKKAYKINKEQNNLSGIASDLGNIGLAYDYMDDYDNAELYYNKSIEIDKKLNYKKGIIISLLNLAGLDKRKSNYLKSKERIEEALILSKEINSKKDIASCLGKLASLHFDVVLDTNYDFQESKTNKIISNEINLNKSLSFINEALEIFKEISNLTYYSSYLHLLAEIYEVKGNYKKAYETYKEYKEINDSVFNLDKAKDIANLEAKRENELKEKEIEILKAEKEKEKVQRYAMLVGIVSLGLVIALVLVQRRRSEKLLLNVLPAKIAKRLKKKEHPIADHFDNASIIFIDIVGFTTLSSGADPKRIVSVLNDIFTKFDKLADKYGLEKIKTIGDAYMAVCGIPEANPNHVMQTALMALSVKKEMYNYKTSDGTEIKFRIGIDCGQVVAGVIGNRKFIYDLWSDAVNTASRMESTSESSKIQITENFKKELEKYKEDWNIENRGEFEIKGKGKMRTYYLN